jgi:hypothetical protein
MLIQPFKIPLFNQYYEGEYSDREIEWRRVCAIDKVSNILALLGGQQVQSVLEVGCGTGAVLAELHTSPIKGRIKMKLRRALLSMSPVLASRIFTYHCGILCSRMPS